MQASKSGSIREKRFDGMSNAFINIFDLLASKTLSNCVLLIEFFTFSEASQLSLFVHFFNLTERKFDRVVLR